MSASSVPDREHDLIARLYGKAPSISHRLAEPVSDFAFWRGRLNDRRGEVVFGMLRGGPRGPVIVTRMADYPPGVLRVPSGGIDHGEAVIDALYREVAEELGLDFTILAYAGKVEFVFAAGGESICFPSYCFLLAEAGTEPGVPLAAAVDDEIESWQGASPAELDECVRRLDALDGHWADWGEYRARTTALIAVAWEQHRAASEAEGEMRFPHDISLPLGPGGAAGYPGDSLPQAEVIRDRPPGQGNGWLVGRWQLSAHAGTHIDAPLHWFAGGEAIDRLDLGRTVGPAVLFDARRATAAGRPAELRDLGQPPSAAAGAVALVRLGLSEEIAAGHFARELHGLALATARAFVEAGATAVGTDALSVDPMGGSESHQILLAAGLPVIEGLDLRGVPAGRYSFAALPLKLLGAEAAPCRVVLLSAREGR